MGLRGCEMSIMDLQDFDYPIIHLDMDGFKSLWTKASTALGLAVSSTPLILTSWNVWWFNFSVKNTLQSIFFKNTFFC